MPEPRPLEDVYALGGLAGGDDQKGGSDKTLLAKMLDPDAGGKGNNRDGLAGLVSPERLSGKAIPETPKTPKQILTSSLFLFLSFSLFRSESEIASAFAAIAETPRKNDGRRYRTRCSRTESSRRKSHVYGRHAVR